MNTTYTINHNTISHPMTSLTLITLTLALACGSVACGPTTHELQTRERQLKTAQSRLRGLESAQATATRYHTHIKTKRSSALSISRAELEAAVRDMLPYVYRGKDLDKNYLRGTISIVKMSEFKLLPGNRAELYLHFDGRKIKTRNVPAIARGQVKSLKGAVRKGKVLIEVNAFVHNKRRLLVLDPRAVQVSFSKNNTGSNKSRFLDVVNRKIFNRQKKIPLPRGIKGDVSALSTPNYLVLIKK